jgi:hypothetical protein
MSINRDDAVLAVRLWAIACHRYIPTTVLPLRVPEPALYAGLNGGGADPAELLTGLADELLDLAEEWRDWQRSSDCRTLGGVS